ncbi:ADP-ribosylation factor-like [Tropilaelaps mercedesae]|uniref:ADP-ribosylation factor-like n=1 Tax=Tropilaelaps mercedesae TaxID=418985 RepID=A0A1V9XZ29_9ACAR|nr:ADP-ribosylation factor-like [Tropilaelaps mercedesae]
MFRLTIALVDLVLLNMAMVTLADDINALTAMCRVHCLTKFSVPGSNTNCFVNWDCWTCWYSCHRFYASFNIWGHMCEKKQFPGCQEACIFYISNSGNLMKTPLNRTLFSQALTYIYSPDFNAVNFEWMLAEDGTNRKAKATVHDLLVQDESTRNWRSLEQTFFTNATIRRSLLRKFSIIRLASYGFDGIIAQTDKRYNEFDFTLHPRKAKEDAKDKVRVTGLDSAPNTGSWIPVLSSERFANAYGAIDAVFNWTNQSRETKISYEVEWRLSDNDTNTETGRIYTRETFARILLWPNSVYLVSVRAFNLSEPDQRATLVAQSSQLRVDIGVHIPGTHMFLNCPVCIALACFITLFAVVLIILAFVYTRLYVCRTNVTRDDTNRALYKLARDICHVLKDDSPGTFEHVCPMTVGHNSATSQYHLRVEQDESRLTEQSPFLQGKHSPKCHRTGLPAKLIAHHSEATKVTELTVHNY